MQAEVNMIELTLEQVRAIAHAGSLPTVIDPTTRQVYALVPAEEVFSDGYSHSMLGAEEGNPQETPVEPWKHLVLRRHPWRKQLSLKGRNMTVRQLLSTVTASRFSEEEAAADLDLPVDAIREALTYAEQNAELLDIETAYERLRLAQGGKRLGPHSLPG